MGASGLLVFQKKQIAHFRWWAVVASSGEFRDLWTLFMSDGKMEIDRQFGAVSIVMQALYQTIVVKKELSHKAKVLIYPSASVLTFTYAHDLCVVTKWTSLCKRRPK